MKNKTFLLVLFAAFSMAVSAQITGTVLEEATDFPVIGARCSTGCIPVGRNAAALPTRSWITRKVMRLV